MDRWAFQAPSGSEVLNTHRSLEWLQSGNARPLKGGQVYMMVEKSPRMNILEAPGKPEPCCSRFEGRGRINRAGGERRLSGDLMVTLLREALF